MPVTFLNPALLFGALGAVVPVIIHFLSRRRTRQIAFSDLRFLAEAESQQSRRRGIRRWLLLLLRVLAVLCLALAMSRPHWGALAAGGDAGRTVLLLLDTSASMQTQGDDGRTLWDVALAQAQELVGALSTSSTVQVVTMGAEARPLFAGWLPAGTSAAQALAAATVTDGPCDLAAGLREAARQVTNAPATPVEIVLLSDLQAAEWPGLEEAARQLAGAGETRLLVHRLGDGVPGGGVLGVELPARALRPGESATLTATVVAERAQQPVFLELDGRRVGEALAPQAGGPFTVAFSLAVPRPGRYHGAVRKESDRFPADDARPFVLEVPARLEILLVHGEDRDALGRGGWRYLQRALAPGNDPESPFHVRDRAVTEFADGDLAAADMLILVDTGPLGRRLQEAVSAWLRAGGAVLVLAGEATQAADLETSLLPLLGLGGGVVFRSRDARRRRARADRRSRPSDPGRPRPRRPGNARRDDLAPLLRRGRGRGSRPAGCRERRAAAVRGRGGRGALGPDALRSGAGGHRSRDESRVPAPGATPRGHPGVAGAGPGARGDRRGRAGVPAPEAGPWRRRRAVAIAGASGRAREAGGAHLAGGGAGGQRRGESSGRDLRLRRRGRHPGSGRGRGAGRRIGDGVPDVVAAGGRPRLCPRWTCAAPPARGWSARSRAGISRPGSSSRRCCFWRWSCSSGGACSL